MKKVLVFAMILCMLALAMTGCSNGGNSTATEAPTEAATEAPVEATEEPAAELFFDFLRRGRSSSMRTEPARWPASFQSAQGRLYSAISKEFGV